MQIEDGPGVEEVADSVKLNRIRNTLKEWKKAPRIETLDRQYAIRCIEHDLGEIDDDCL